MIQNHDIQTSINFCAKTALITFSIFCLLYLFKLSLRDDYPIKRRYIVEEILTIAGFLTIIACIITTGLTIIKLLL